MHKCFLLPMQVHRPRRSSHAAVRKSIAPPQRALPSPLLAAQTSTQFQGPVSLLQRRRVLHRVRSSVSASMALSSPPSQTRAPAPLARCLPLCSTSTRRTHSVLRFRSPTRRTQSITDIVSALCEYASFKAMLISHPQWFGRSRTT